MVEGDFCMKKLLHIIATPRRDDSRTLQVSRAFLDGVKKKYTGCAVDTLNLFTETLPELVSKSVEGKYLLLSGKDLVGEYKTAWKNILQCIKRFLAADAYLISTPMWNFGIPYRLKHYIDVILQPKYLFTYTPQGFEGLVKDKKMVIITSRGGDYSPGTPMFAYDRLEPYLRTVFGFVGITDLEFINAQPMDAAGADVMKIKLQDARKYATELAKNF